MEKANFLIRPATKDDHSFIYSSWLKSFRDGPAVKGITNQTFYKEQHDLIESLLLDPTTTALVACNPSDDSQIYGYIVASGSVLHWVYVKLTFRQFGIAKTLELGAVKGDKKFYTHLPKMMHRTCSQFANYEYNPYLLSRKG